jgi:hypothetical protein
MQDHQGPSLQALARKYRDSSCADPRDKVFALLGLVEISIKREEDLPQLLEEHLSSLCGCDGVL